MRYEPDYRTSRSRILHRVAGPAAAAALLLMVPTVSAGQTPPPDAEVTRTVQAELSHDAAVETGEFRISTQDGVVTLRGTVESLPLKDSAERLTEAVNGVKSVVNQIQVQPRDPPSDAEIRSELEEAFRADPSGASYEVATDVKDGVVTLTGSVDSFTELRLVESMARGIRGARDVVDQISIDPQAVRRDDEIQREVEGRLQWDTRVGGGGLIDTSVDEGQVVLRGIVGSAAERTQAITDAWVTSVRDVDASGLTVTPGTPPVEGGRGEQPPLPDEEIEAAVQRALFYDPRVLETTVFVDSKGGAVTLSGEVENLQARRGAEEVARHTMGVVSVDNQLTVDPNKSPSDAEIALEIQEAMDRDPFLAAESIEPSVAAGKVTLLGEVRTRFARARADEIAARISGVLEVDNRLEVRG